MIYKNISIVKMYFNWYQRMRIKLFIFFDKDKIGLTFYDKNERDVYEKSNCFKKLWIRKKHASQKTKDLEIYLMKETLSI